MSTLFGSKKTTRDEPRQIFNNRFSLMLTPEWQDQSIYFYQGPELEGQKIQLSVQPDNAAGNISAENYAERIWASLAGELQGARLLHKEPGQLRDETPTMSYVFQWCPQEKIELIQRFLIVVKNGTAWQLSCLLTPKNWKTQGRAVTEMMNSFLPDQ